MNQILLFSSWFSYVNFFIFLGSDFDCVPDLKKKKPQDFSHCLSPDISGSEFWRGQEVGLTPTCLVVMSCAALYIPHPNLTQQRRGRVCVCESALHLVDSQIKHLKPQAKCSRFIGGLKCSGGCLTDADPHTFGLALGVLMEKTTLGLM